MTSIKLDEATLGSILKTKPNLCVPPSQRAYAWEKEHVTDLFHDLTSAQSRNNEEYFLGAIIVIANEHEVRVFDGQQRLATTMILVSAIRDALSAMLKHDAARSIDSEYIHIVDRRTQLRTPRFTLSTDDAEYFTSRICGVSDIYPNTIEKSKESHKRLADAFTAAQEHVNAKIKTLRAEDVENSLHDLLDFIDQKARVIWVQVQDDQTAYRIFETMNDRGLKLSAADLVKNYLYSRAGTHVDLVLAKWVSMISNLETLGKEGDPVDFIRYHWVSTNGQTRSSELFDKVKAKVNSQVEIRNYMQSLEIGAQHYSSILTPSHEDWSSNSHNIRNHLSELSELGISQVRPLLLAAKPRFTSREFSRLVENVTNWSVRCLIGGVSSGNLEGVYARAAYRVTTGVTNCDDLFQDVLHVVPDDERLLRSAELASVGQSRLARYYLRKLQETEDASTEYVPNNDSTSTLEHVLPKNPGADWDHFSAEEQRQYKSRLGNLVLLQGEVNARLGNVAFAAKAEAFRSSALSLTRIVGESTDWTKDSIEERQRRLAALAVRAWPLQS